MIKFFKDLFDYDMFKIIGIKCKIEYIFGKRGFTLYFTKKCLIQFTDDDLI